MQHGRTETGHVSVLPSAADAGVSYQPLCRTQALTPQRLLSPSAADSLEQSSSQELPGQKEAALPEVPTPFSVPAACND